MGTVESSAHHRNAQRKMNAPQPPAQKGPVETYPAQAKRQELRSALDDQLLDEIYGGLQLAKSYAESMMLACVRGDRHELLIRRRQVSASLKHAFEAHTMLTGGAK
jgi:hypothetical protein